MFCKFKRADSINEFAILLSIISLVFFSMNTYVKRSVQARVKDLTDGVISSKHLNQINLGETDIRRHTRTASAYQENFAQDKILNIRQEAEINTTSIYQDPDKAVHTPLKGDQDGISPPVLPYPERH